VILASVRGQRELPLEQLYTGYRKNVMASDEVLAYVRVPQPQTDEHMQAYKVSKRFEDDISAVCLAVNLHMRNGQVTHASIGAGGVAATPVRAIQTEAALAGQAWSQTTVARAMEVLKSEFTPISDMRASADYRREVLGNLLQRFWLEASGQAVCQVHCIDFDAAVPTQGVSA
jgi:xanthine dehydrogenase small subunit